jgi:hypothetical protein
MPDLTVKTVLSSFNQFFNPDESPRNKQDFAEKMKVDFNQANHYLSSQMEASSYKTFKFAVQEAGWLATIGNKATAIFNHFFRSTTSDDSDLTGIEVKDLYLTLQERSKHVSEKMTDKMLDMLSSLAIESDSKGFFDAAKLVYSYAATNTKWAQDHKNELLKIHKKIEEGAQPGNFSSEEIIELSSLVEKIFGEKATHIDIVVGDTTFSINRSKILYASALVRKMLIGPFAETGSSSITLKGIDEESFKHFIQYIDCRDTSVLQALTLKTLTEVNACSSHLFADVETRTDIIAQIDQKVDDMTIEYSADRQVELAFQEELSEPTIDFLSDVVVQHETGLIDLRAAAITEDRMLQSILGKFSNTKLLFITYSESLTRNGWLALVNSGKVSDLHLDFSHIDMVLPQSFLEIQKLANTCVERNLPFRIHIENAGKLELDALREIATSLGDFVLTLDLSGSKINDAQLTEVIQHFPNLEKVKLDYCKQLRGVGYLEMIADKCPDVKELSLYQSGKFKENSLIYLVNKMESLVKLNVGWHHYLTDHFVKELATKCKKLQVVDFTNLKLITDESFKELVTKCSLLAEMKLDYCQKLTKQIFTDLTEMGHLQKLSISEMLPRRNPLSLEVLEDFMKSKKEPFELVISKESPDKDAVINMGNNYPMVTVSTA